MYSNDQKILSLHIIFISKKRLLQMRQVFLFAFISLISVTVRAQLAAGTIAPEISLPGTNDSIINLSSFKGKVVLIDFWASWCRPCREAIPGVVKLYNKYKAQGFEVLGVSIDSKKPMWLKAMADDKITYTQVNDSMGWNAKVTEVYNVNEIPATFLLDKTGKIIVVNAEGTKLERKIKMLLK
jgi:peroxiredoxin